MTTFASHVAPSPPRPRALSIAAVLTACALFPLIFVGAGVTSTDSGMAYADWPTSAGHLVNPPEWWQSADTRWEHGHRLIGWAVGMLAIVVAVLSWRSGGLLRIGGVGLLIAIIIQGVLGGLRVKEVSTTLAMVHGIWGQLCFCLACSLALVSSNKWYSMEPRRSFPAANYLRRLCTIGAICVFVQLVLGAALRHFGSTPAMVGHLLWAVIVALILGWIGMWIVAGRPACWRFGSNHLLGRLGRAVAVLLVVQLLLGGLAFVATFMHKGSAFLSTFAPSAHVAVGALLLACSVALALAAHKGLSPVSTRNGMSLPNESVLT